MKLGVSTYSFLSYITQTGCDLKEVAQLTKEIGFDVLDVTESSLRQNPNSTDIKQTARELRDYCKEIGLELGAMMTGANIPTEENAVEFLCEMVDVAAELGVSTMRFDVCHTLPEGMVWEQALEMMVPKIRQVADYAQSKGIMTCSENHGIVVQAIDRIKSLFDTVNHPNYRWLVDMGNFICVDGDPLEGVRHAAPYIVRAHIKDLLYRKVSEMEIVPEGALILSSHGNWIRGTILGHGDIPVIECTKILRKAGFDGTYTLEFEGPESNLPALKQCFAYMQKLAAMPF